MPGHRRYHTQSRQNYNQNMTRKSGHELTVANDAKDNAAKREAYRRERKIESYLADDENFPTFADQLQKVGLELRDIPADGNCLFRALGDQLEGHCRSHYKHRQDVVRFMVENRHDFEAFVEDDLSFDTHIQNLKKLGTYAGNDAIVAFARLHQVNIVIQQLNAKHLMITGCSNPKAGQLHIAYHNGDHYSSVRKLQDNTESPANIRIQDDSPTPWAHSHTSYSPTVYSQSGAVRAVRGCQAIEEEVIAATKCHDLKTVRETLSDCAYDADAAIAHLMQLMELTAPDGATTLHTDTASSPPETGVWSNGSQSKMGQRVHFRGDSIGGSSGYGSMASSQGGARPKLYNMATQQQTAVPKTGRRIKEQKRMEKKSRAEERHRQRILGSKQTLPGPEPPTFTVQAPRNSSITII